MTFLPESAVEQALLNQLCFGGLLVKSAREDMEVSRL